MIKTLFIILFSFLFISCSTISTRRLVQNYEKNFEKSYSYEKLFDATLVALTTNGLNIVSIDKNNGSIIISNGISLTKSTVINNIVMPANTNPNTTILLRPTSNGILLVTSDRFDQHYEFYDDEKAIIKGNKGILDEEKAKVEEALESWKKSHDHLYNAIVNIYKTISTK